MKALISFLFLSLCFTSCTPPYYVSTNSYADRQRIPYGFAFGSSFAIISENKDDSFFSREVAYKVALFLQESGFRVCDVDHADFVLSFSTNMTSKVSTVDVPVYVPGPTYVRQGCVWTDGCSRPYQEITETGSTVMLPEQVKLYDRHLCLKVYDSSQFSQEGAQEIWFGESQSSGVNCDFRDTIDYLLVTAFRHFGQNTPSFVTTAIDENDKTVRWIKQSMISGYYW